MATVRALKYNGGVPKTELTNENVEALEKGIVNLKTHIENMHKFGVPVVVAINRFHTDTEAELAVIERVCGEMGVEFSLRFLQKALRAVSTLRKRFARLSKQSRLSSSRFMTRSSLSRISLIYLRKRYIVQTA